MPDFTYFTGDQSFQVTEEDRVMIKQKDKLVVVGYNHARAWRAALVAAGAR